MSGLSVDTVTREIVRGALRAVQSEMEALIEKLLARRSRIRELIEDFGRSDRAPFPKWGAMGKNGKDIWDEGRWKINMAGRLN